MRNGIDIVYEAFGFLIKPVSYPRASVVVLCEKRDYLKRIVKILCDCGISVETGLWAHSATTYHLGSTGHKDPLDYLLSHDVLEGVPPAFRKKPTLRTCKILYKKSGDIGNYGEAEKPAKIGMYKKMHRSIEQKKADPLLE